MAENINLKRKEDDHSLTLLSRKSMKISGVAEVIGFDSSYVELETSCGRLFVDGEEIKISVLDTENRNVELCGKISALTYSESDGREKRSLFKRMRQ